MKSLFTIFIFLTVLHIKPLIAFSQEIIDENNLLTTTQKETLLQHLKSLNSKSGNHLKILVLDDQNSTLNARKYTEKQVKTWGMDKKDIILISLPKINSLTAYLGDDINTEITSYESNNILDRATMYDGGGSSDFFTMIYLLIVQPDNTSFSTEKTHFDKLEHATLEYKYLLEHHTLPLTKSIKINLKEPTDWKYLYMILALILAFRLRDDGDKWIVSFFMGAIFGIVSFATGLGNPILVFLIFAIWSSFSKVKPKDLLQKSKNPKKRDDRDEDNHNAWDDDD